MKKTLRGWRWPIQLKAIRGDEAWAYVSASGKTVEVYIAEKGKDPLKAKISIPYCQRWVKP